MLARLARGVMLGTLVLWVGSAHAQSRALTWESGIGDGVELWRVGLQLAPRPVATVRSWKVTLAWEAQIGQWRSRAGGAASRPVWDVGLTPLVRFAPPPGRRWTAFVEGAVGAHLISRNKVHRRLDMSSAYQFGDHVGIGVRVGTIEVVFRHQHLSNASTVQPNHGANFNILRAVYYLP